MTPDPRPAVDPASIVVVIVTVEVTDPPLLRAYTSAFMPVGSVEDRVQAVLTGAHMLLPALNGLRIIESETEPERDSEEIR